MCYDKNRNLFFIYYSLPVFAGIESVAILHETVLPAQIVGGGLILGGICAATLPASRTKK